MHETHPSIAPGKVVFRAASAALLVMSWAFAPGAGAACATAPDLTAFSPAGWGLDERNTRFQPQSGIDASNVAGLTLKWAYGLATRKPRSWPLVTPDTIFIGDTGAGLVALDRETGCTRWVFEHTGEIGSAILHHRIGDRDALLFNDRNAGIYAVDARNGELIWHGSLTEPPVPMYSGTPLLHGNALFVPVSSLEIGLAINPLYGCCTTSGAVARLDADSGESRWYRPSIDTPPHVTGRHWLMVEEHGPSGAPVWGSPTLDTVRGALYFGTGQNYSRPTTATSDAVFSVDANTGAVRWTHQFTAQDAYNMACGISTRHPNCPRPVGPDVDFGAPPMLVHAGDTALIIAGQKAGDVFALNPDNGAVVWHQQLGRGGALGGIHWGMAANEPLGLVLVPVSDISALSPDREPRPGLNALDLATGAVRWQHIREPRCDERVCSGGLSAAIISTKDLVFAGTLDGYLEIYRASNGEVLWSRDSWRDYDTVNGVPASGGSFDAHGPLVVDDQVIVSSGYDSFGQKGGNALLVFELSKKEAP